jgi:hypothetical protein
MDAHQERKEASMKAWRKETTACQEATEVYLERNEPIPEEMANATANLEVPKEDTAVRTIGVLEDRYADRHLAVGYSRQLKKRIHGGGGYRRKLAAPADG